MATKTIDHMGFYVAVKPYTTEDNGDQVFDTLSMSVCYTKGKGFRANYHPGWNSSWGGFGCVFDFDSKPLTGTTYVDIEPAAKNNVKRLTQFKTNLEAAKDDIVWLFDERKWDELNRLIKDVAVCGYTPGIEQRMKDMKNPQGIDNAPEESPMMKQFRKLKTAHKNAILLFRCGDYYETYEDDAVEAAKILGITLTKSTSTGVRMAGFPHHALDTYLPRLIRAGKRVAICDPLPEPPKTKRGITETIGTTEDSNSTNNQNSEDEVMTNETMKVTDLIGKSVCNGNAKYVIKSVDGDKVKVDFAMGDNAAKEMNMKAEQIEKLLQGGWTVGDGTQEPTKQETPKTEEPKAKTVTMEKSKAEKSAKPKVTLRKEQPQAEEPETKAGKLVYSTYTNAKGKACAKVSGFAETDAAYQQAVSLHGSATYENTKQGRVNFLLFGPRYAEVAKTVCQMLNEGETVADCQAVVDHATEERAQKREERKQKREAKREGKAQTAKPQGKTYTEQEVADLMRRVIEGDKEAIAIVNAMAA